MNLELLFEATKLSGDSTYRKIAISHADTTLAHHFRPDNSCYHVVDYDKIKGGVRSRQTAQGYTDESSWALRSKHGLCMVIPYVTVKQKIKNIWNRLKKVYDFIFNNKTCLRI